MKKLLVVLTLALMLVGVANAQVKDEYSVHLKEMIGLSGAKESYTVAISQMMKMFKQQKPNVPIEVWNGLEAEFKKNSLDNLVEMLVPVYKKHLTLDDVKGMIKFFKTPVGKKYAQKTPLIMQESMQVGQSWGMKIGQDFMKKLAEKGY